MNTFTTGLNATAQKRGFQTSQNMGNSSQLFADKFNKHVNSFRAIQADQTRTRAEKSALLSKLEKVANRELEIYFESTAQSHLARSLSANSDRESYLSISDKAVALELAKHIKGSKDEVRGQLVANDPRYAQALNSMPSQYFGLSQETVDSMSNRSIAKHKPELYSSFQQLSFDQKHLDNMKNFVSDAKRSLVANIDSEALETRFESDI